LGVSQLHDGSVAIRKQIATPAWSENRRCQGNVIVWPVFTGNAGYNGIIYAPNADMSLSGGGNNTLDFCGMSVTRNVSLNGHYNFHYDEALGRLSPISAYIISSWNEL
jgi:hypothetical protein